MKAIQQLHQITQLACFAIVLVNAMAAVEASHAQDAGGADVRPFQPGPVEPLAAGEFKVLQAAIIDVKGRARWQPSETAAWKSAAIDDLLEPGAIISTGVASSVTVRVGHNATIFVDANTRLVLPEVAQEGNTLRTRAGLPRGRADFKVEGVGLTNDFVVVTPTATLAVKGTGYSVIVSALDGVQVLGVRENMIRAIELAYFFKKIRVYVSGQGKSSQRHPDPVLAAMHDTLSPPTSWAAGLEAVGELENGFKVDTFLSDTRQIQFGLEEQERIREIVEDDDTPPTPEPPNPDDIFDFDPSQHFDIAVFICEFEAMIFGQFEDELRRDGIFKQSQFQAMRNEIAAICSDLEGREDPLFDQIFAVVTYCINLNKTQHTNECIDAFVHAFSDTFNDYYSPPRSNKPNDGRRRKR